MSSFLTKYQETNSKVKGIPGFVMNAPMYDFGTRGAIGLELELEGANLVNDGYLDGVKGPKSRAVWQSKLDGSLRNGGREYVLSKPCEVEDLKPLLEGLFKRFEENRVRLNNTNRCSTHVHINVNGLRVNLLTSILGFWKIFEEPLIQWCGIERTTNHFCLSSKDENATIEAWKGFLETGRRDWAGGLKYSAINICTLAKFGSFEFRCGAASNDPVMPEKWATFLYYMVEYVKANYSNPSRLAPDLSELGAVRLFRNVCESSNNLLIAEDFFSEVMANYPVERDFNEVCMQGFRNAQPFILGFPWDDWLPEIEKEFVPNPFEKVKKKEPQF